MDFKTELSKVLGPELTSKVKALYAKFNTVPVVQSTPVAPAAPVVDPNAVPVQAQEDVLSDGTTIKYDTPTLAVGSVVTVVSPEGEMPAPVGEHTLQDGTKIVLGEGGIVESVTPVAAPAAPATPVIQTAPNIAPVLAQMAEMEKRFKTEKAVNEKLTKELTAFKASVQEDFKSLLEVLKPILDQPSADPLEKPANKFQKTKKENPLNKYINRNN